MNGIASDRRSSDFSRWLRTGRLPTVRTPDGVEVKFNPWHDPADGRFTFAGSGERYDPGGASERAPGRGNAGARKSPVATPTEPGRHAKRLAGEGRTSPRRDALKGRSTAGSAGPRGDSPNPVVEFIGGVGEGLYDAGEGAVDGVREMLTTHPLTTAHNIGLGAARLVDTATAAENTPALKHIARARAAVANASAREIGHATGSVGGDVALTVAPGAAVSKIAALRRLRMARPTPVHRPLEVGWVKENLGKDSAAKRYNDAALGARPGQAPTLMRTMPDGKRRKVKFDGVENDFLIDRKLKIVDLPNARNQVERQTHALIENGRIAIYDVPNAHERLQAFKLLKKMKVKNFKVRIVKP